MSLEGSDTTLLRAGRRKKDFLLAWQQLSQSETVTTQPMKSHYISNSQFPPMDFLFITVLPSLPLSSIKELPLLCFSCTS